MYIHKALDIEELERLIPQWQDLSSNSSDPNIFYEPCMFIPAVKYLQQSTQVEYLFIFKQKSDDRIDNLLGFFPFQIIKSYHHIPIKFMSLWKHYYCFLCNPLIRHGYEDVCIKSIYQWLSQSNHYPKLIYWNEIVGGSFFHKTLLNYLNKNYASAYYSHSKLRAFIDKSKNTSKPIELFSSKHQKDLRRKERRLNELGKVSYNFGAPQGNLDKLIDEFTQLEAKGWKGEQKTAIKCSQSDLDFAKECFRNANDQSKFSVATARLNGKLISANTLFHTGKVAFAFKVAYDEALAKYSPGIILHMKENDWIMKSDDILCFDSCSDPKNKTANKIFQNRRTIVSIISSSRIFPEGLFLKYILPFLKSSKIIYKKLRRLN